MGGAQPSNQNHVLGINLASVCERYDVLDLTGAAAATCVLQDVGIIN